MTARQVDNWFEVADHPYFEKVWYTDDPALEAKRMLDELVQPSSTSADPVNTPTHYQHPSGIEVIEITRHESFLRGNVIKYVLRAPYKGNELEDLKKAAKYLQWEIERVENAVPDAE